MSLSRSVLSPPCVPSLKGRAEHLSAQWRVRSHCAVLSHTTYALRGQDMKLSCLLFHNHVIFMSSLQMMVTCSHVPYVHSSGKCVGASETRYSNAPAIRAQVQMKSSSNVQTSMKRSDIQEICRTGCRSAVAVQLQRKKWTQMSYFQTFSTCCDRWYFFMHVPTSTCNMNSNASNSMEHKLLALR